MRNDWYLDFFHGVAVEFWRRAVPADWTLAEVDFIVDELKLPRCAHVLDVPCGHGRHTVELARRGLSVTGVDISPECLALAQDAARDAGAQADWIKADMGQLQLPREFDAAICLGNAFGYADRDGTLRFLKAVGEALRPGGGFVLQTGACAESILPNLKSNLEFEAGDIRMRVDNHYDTVHSRLETKYSFLQDGVVDERDACQWVFTLAEIERMLAEAGLRLVARYSSTDRQPYALGSGWLLAVAIRA